MNTTLAEYLVTSRARRAVLRELSVARGAVSVRALARRARVSYSNAHREVGRMERAGLLRRTVAGPSSACRLDPSSAAVPILRRLFAAAGSGGGRRRIRPPLDAVPDPEILGNLRRYGAPLVVPDGGSTDLGLEETLALALGLARRRPDVARALPVVLHSNRDAMDMAALRALATRLGHRRVLGFFLDLTHRLTGDRSFLRAARAMKDARFRKFEHFFGVVEGSREDALTKLRTPPVAKSWFFWMNASVDSFRKCLGGNRHAAE